MLIKTNSLELPGKIDELLYIHLHYFNASEDVLLTSGERARFKGIALGIRLSLEVFGFEKRWHPGNKFWYVPPSIGIFNHVPNN